VRLVPNLMVDRAGILAVQDALDAYRAPAPAPSS
jgi:hypothetical protein